MLSYLILRNTYGLPYKKIVTRIKNNNTSNNKNDLKIGG